MSNKTRRGAIEFARNITRLNKFVSGNRLNTGPTDVSQPPHTTVFQSRNNIDRISDFETLNVIYVHTQNHTTTNKFV